MIINEKVRELVNRLETNPTDNLLSELIETLDANCAQPQVRQRYQAYAAKQDRIDPSQANLSAYPMDEDGYAHAFDVLHEEAQIWETWSKYGFVVDKNVIDGPLCEKTMARIREVASNISDQKFSIDDPSTHQFMPTDPNGTPLISRGFFEIYHDDSLAQLRQAIRVYLHHVVIWGRTDLWTTYDRYGVKLAGHPDSKGLPLHVDQNVTVHPTFRTVQGVLALTDCPTQRGTFVAVPESKKLFPQYGDIVEARQDNYKGEYVELDLSRPFAKNLEAARQIIPLRAGSIVSWDSRTTHANSPNISGEPRLVAYISAGPAPEYDDKAIVAREDAFKTGLGSNVRDAKMHASMRPRYTAPDTIATVRKPEQLNYLGSLLYGFTRHKRPTQSHAKLLVNAEAYGFGPTAAIADFFPLLRQQFQTIAFVGPKHTLDLQEKLPYDAIYDQDKMTLAEFDALLDQYDVFFTAFDFERAQMAIQRGKPTIFYDCLTWFWQDIHPILAHDNALYLAQDFFGVRERIAANPKSYAHPIVVKPILKAISHANHKDIVLVNLGGIKNPHWSNEDVIAYAKTIIEALNLAIPHTENVVIAASQVVCNALKDPRIKTYTREEISALLPRVKYAAVTPGLSNIYDMSQYAIPTLYLPPANDSQGLQAKIMNMNNMADAWMDWSDIGKTVNYSNQAQAVLANISACGDAVNNDRDLRTKFVETLSQKMRDVSELKISRSHALVEKFGTGGIEEVVSKVRSFADYHISHKEEHAVKSDAKNQKVEV